MAQPQIVKQVKNAILYDNGTIRIDGVRLSYVHYDKPWKKEGDDGTPKYGSVALLGKDTHKEAKALLKEHYTDLLKDKGTKNGKACPLKLPPDKMFLRDGDTSGKDEYEGFWTLNASETKPPSIRNAKGRKLTPPEIVALFFSGCWGSVLIRPWYQNNKHGKRVNAGLVASKFEEANGRDDTPFGEGRISEDDIDSTYDYDDSDDDGDGGFEDDEDDSGL